MMDTQDNSIRYVLNNKDYILVEVMVVAGSKSEDEKMKIFNCLPIGFKKVRPGGFWQKTYGIIKVLVPEEKIEEFFK